MGNTKTEIRFFTVPQWKKEENYLRGQHKNGWEFVCVNGFCLYHFRKCEPKDVVYQLDYNPDSISHKNEYVQMFCDCGWEYMQNYAGYSYFRKAACDMDGKEEGIFCDDASRLDMMKRVFKGRMIPLVLIFFLVVIPQMVMQSQVHTAFNQGLLAVFCIMFVLYLATFLLFAVPFWNYYKSAHKK